MTLVLICINQKPQCTHFNTMALLFAYNNPSTLLFSSSCFGKSFCITLFLSMGLSFTFWHSETGGTAFTPVWIAMTQIPDQCSLLGTQFNKNPISTRSGKQTHTEEVGTDPKQSLNWQKEVCMTFVAQLAVRNGLFSNRLGCCQLLDWIEKVSFSVTSQISLFIVMSV